MAVCDLSLPSRRCRKALLMSQIRNVALGVAVRDGHLLVIDELDAVRGQRFHRLVGGGIEFGETSEQALRRELHEELGADLRSSESLGVLENIFEYEGEPGHQIAHLYLVESDAIDSLALDETRKVADEDARVHWVDLSALDLPLYPDGAEEIIASVLAARESDVEQFWARATGHSQRGARFMNASGGPTRCPAASSRTRCRLSARGSGSFTPSPRVAANLPVTGQPRRCDLTVERTMSMLHRTR